jgi:hypothetical protein
LIGEKFSDLLPEGVENYTSRAMQWGRETEEEARRYFERNGMEARRCGFCMTDDKRFGCSPDSLVYSDGVLVGGLELKCPEPTEHVRTLRKGTLPDKHRAQVHGGLIVTGLPRWWFMSYCPGRKPMKSAFEISIVPDVYTSALRAALDVFWGKYQAALTLIEEQ